MIGPCRLSVGHIFDVDGGWVRLPAGPLLFLFKTDKVGTKCYLEPDNLAVIG